MEPDEQDTLLVLAYLYLTSGDERRAVILLLLVERSAPNNLSALRALAYAYTETGMAERALLVLDKLSALGGEEDRQGVLLLRSRALMVMGRPEEAKACFASFIESRRQVPRLEAAA